VEGPVTKCCNVVNNKLSENIVSNYNNPNFLTPISSTPICNLNIYNKRLTIADTHTIPPPSPISRPPKAKKNAARHVAHLDHKENKRLMTSRPAWSISDTGSTGNYLALPDIRVLRDVKLSSAAEQISVAVATGILVKSTHHGYLDVPGHGAMIAYVFPQLKGSLLSISALINVGLHVTYCNKFVTAFDVNENIIFQGKRNVRN
jgi:hypothetical protein